jgi:DNA-binding GntR family transcriptional regulator
VARRPEPKTRNMTLTEKAYHGIKRAILMGEISEGTFLSETEIRRNLGIGRTPFREACNRLHNEQLLEVVPHHGYFVPELSFRAVRDIFETRLILEAAVAELAATRAEPGQIKELEAIGKEVLSYIDSPNEYEKVVKGNTKFHLCLAKMTQNRELFELARKIHEQTERLSFLEYRRAGFKKKLTLILHGPIIEAIRKRDPVAARKAVIRDIAEAQVITMGMAPDAKPMRLPDFVHERAQRSD